MYAAERRKNDENSLQLFGCGNTSEGQLGAIDSQEDGENVMSLSRLVSNILTEKSLAEVACGYQHSLFLLDDGSVYSCGNNDAGQLGRDGYRKKLGLISHLQGLLVLQISCGSTHSVALVDDRHAFAWGSNAFGQLGISADEKVSYINVPQEINLSKIIQVACGKNHTMALCSDGLVHAWGDNKHGQLGIGHGGKKHYLPQMLKSLVGVPFGLVVAGGDHSVVVTLSGAVFAWGRNNYGQLGLGDTTDRDYPVHVKQLRSRHVFRVSCGESHTAAMTKEGGLFTYGAGNYGQLGHGTTVNESLPKQVFELMGSKVTDVSCGRCHTLVIVKGKMYAFGLGGSGQLGLREGNRNRLTPSVVNSIPPVTRVFAGGDQSFVLCSSARSVDSSPAIIREPVLVLERLTLEGIKQYPSMDINVVVQEVEFIVSNLSCLNGSFLKKNDEHYFTTNKNCGVDVDEVMEGFQLLSEMPNADRISSAMLNSLQSKIFLQLNALPPDIEALRVYVILPWCHLFNNMDAIENLHFPFALVMHQLGAIPWKIIESWWSSFSARHLNRILKIFKQVISTALSCNPKDFQNRHKAFTQRNLLRVCLEVLSHLHKVIVKSQALPLDAFYVNDLAEKFNMRAEYLRWLSPNPNSDDDFSLCAYPFVFNGAVKTQLLQTDAALQMEIHFRQAVEQNFQSLLIPFIPPENVFLLLVVSRDNIVHDTITQLGPKPSIDLKKPLKVQFRGEEGVDEGGVKKEFFLILFQELLHPKYGMFVECQESRRLWFSNFTAEEDPVAFQLIGILIGLAIYNSVIVALPFPLALYKKLLKKPVTLEDLKELSPTEGRSLESLLDYEDDDFEDVFSLTFTMNVEVFGVLQTAELKPGGAAIAVTKHNRQEYVDLYVDYKLNQQIKTQYQPFTDGFFRAVNQALMELFQPVELMEMVIGHENYDWDAFEKSTAYHGEYWPEHPTIKLFWAVFRSLAQEDKRKFLLFLTGSDRVPILGMKEIVMNIQPTAGGEQYLPVSHTCFNLLDLPKYKSANVLKAKLLEAIQYTQGFTLV